MLSYYCFYHYFSTLLKIRHYLSMENPLILVSCEKTVLFAYISYVVNVFKISRHSHHQMTSKKEQSGHLFSCFCRVPGLSFQFLRFCYYLDFCLLCHTLLDILVPWLVYPITLFWFCADFGTCALCPYLVHGLS
jgi:hypothetical protein